MRIFHYYMFRLKKVYPKQIQGLVEQYLNENQLSYHNLLFYFMDYIINYTYNGENQTNRETNNIVNLCDKYPELKPLHRIEKDRTEEFILSNFLDNWIPTAHQVPDDLILSILSKIPRPYNFCDSNVFFDSIDFFGRASEPTGKNKDPLHPQTPIGSYICYIKDGVENRWNLINLCIDVTADDGLTALEDSRYVQSMKNLLPGMLWNTTKVFALSNEERIRYAEIDASIADIVSKATEDCHNPSGRLGAYLPAPINGVWGKYSLKSALTRNIKVYGYEYRNFQYYMYQSGKKDRYGHDIEIEMDQQPTCKGLDTQIVYRGIGFEYRFQLPSVAPSNQQEADDYVAAVMEYLAYFESAFLSSIGAAYPPTPQI